jgi:hypothetical protein
MDALLRFGFVFSLQVRRTRFCWQGVHGALYTKRSTQVFHSIFKSLSLFYLILNSVTTRLTLKLIQRVFGIVTTLLRYTDTLL